MRCWGGQLRGSPVYRPRNNAQSYGGLSETAAALAINRKGCLTHYWDCLQGSGASTLHAESKGSCYLLKRIWKKNLQYQCGSCGFPRPLLQIYYRKTKERHAIKVQRGRQTQSRGEANRAQMFQERDTDRHGLAWNTGAGFQTLFWASLIKSKTYTFLIESLQWFRMYGNASQKCGRLTII